MGQALDKNGKIIASMKGNNFEDLVKKLSEVENVHSIRMAKLPNKGDIIEIDGLKYEVTYIDKQLGKLHLKIK